MLELKNICFEITDEKGTVKIIDDISLTLEDGKFVVITGPNGSGKSTLAKIIMGIEKPTSGQILLDGVEFHNYLVLYFQLLSRLNLEKVNQLEVKIDIAVFRIFKFKDRFAQ